MQETARRARSGWLVAAGIATAAVGAALTAAGMTYKTASFGWFAYAPLSDATFVPSNNLLSAVELFGYGVLIVGVVILAWMLGYHRSPRARWPFLPGASRARRWMLGALAGAVTLLALAGGALLASRPPSFPDAPADAAPGQETSSAYSSELLITWDAAYGPTFTPGVLLLVGGLVLSAVVLGWRAGQPAHAPAESAS